MTEIQTIDGVKNDVFLRRANIKKLCRFIIQKLILFQIRRGFIRKVYGILMIQLIVTGAFIAVFTFVESVRVWTRQSPWLYIVALVVLVVSTLNQDNQQLDLKLEFGLGKVLGST